MNQQCKTYPREQAERYLLNKLSWEDETAFQLHLKECEACRSYIQTIRRFAQSINDKELDLPIVPPARKTIGRRLNLSRWISIAASILLVAGFSLYYYSHQQSLSGENNSEHELLINEQHRAKKEYIGDSVELIFPNESICTIDLQEDPLLFKWAEDAYFELQLTHENKILLEMQDYGKEYAPNSEKIKPYSWVDWVLLLNGQEKKGRIYFIDKQ
ncbi:hypothetical protein M2480_000966 [Parabacteroides sp. PFB2-12]|uniref:anti-sigma factor family protein n=1 Tax=unclassified Parabacteroides TaxID=2649774 RepID=UPI0024734EEC|nr:MULTISPECIES: zf-HC2 domain-containing protein [unclassified Parabacteroides]MDH6341577.1 hypothetical protein [Parabacteroides sp. PM6-13]MDH6390000.1 hypothetical protein [Parabacteroides sp. PFB2-12]